MKKILACLLAVILAVWPASCQVQTPKEYTIDNAQVKLIVHFIDVGQGDSTLLESAGEFVLIDAGEKEYGDDVVDYLRSRCADTLKYVIATHPHSDHVGGLTKVINTVSTQNFITSETDQTTRTWLNVLDAVDRNDVNYIDAEPGATYSFGEAEFTVLGPLSQSSSGYNNDSVVIRAACGDIRFLLTGDAEKQSEKELLNAGTDLKADVLKCGHHGSSSSSTAKFLKAVRPTYAVISCGEDNDYGHPHKETLQKLEMLGCTVYRTDEDGTVIAYTDGHTLSFSTEKGGASAADHTAAPDNGTTAAEEETTAPKSDTAVSYIGNRNSHIFHQSTCSGVSNMKDSNKVYFVSRQQAVDSGYDPCSLCNP